MKFRPFIAEFIGTFTLIFIGAGAGALGVGGLVGVAFAHGLVIMVFAYVFGPISGSHINPAVTLGMLVGGQIKAKDAVSYWVAQFIGGALGAATLLFVLGDTIGNLGATTLSANTSELQGIVLEAILTFLLVNTIFHTAVKGNGGDMAPLAIGMTLTLAILMGGPLTGGSLNPARTFGPALFTDTLDQFWVYLVGTGAGGILAGLFYKYFSE